MDAYDSEDLFENDYRANQYRAKRQPGELNLIQEVVNLMTQVGLGKKVNLFYNDQIIQDAVGKVADVQRYHINRYWNRQFMVLENTIDVRFCLVPDGPVETWLKIFEERVIPEILERDLPQAF